MTMSGDDMASPSLQPIMLSMSVDDDDSFESEYRVRIGNQVKYLVISPGTSDRDTLSFPLPSLPPLPDNGEEWIVATISRDKTSGDVRTALSNPNPSWRPLSMASYQGRLSRLGEDKTAHGHGLRSHLSLAHSPVVASSHHGRQNSSFRMGAASHQAGNPSIPVARERLRTGPALPRASPREWTRHGISTGESRGTLCFHPGSGRLRSRSREAPRPGACPRRCESIQLPCYGARGEADRL